MRVPRSLEGRFKKEEMKRLVKNRKKKGESKGSLYSTANPEHWIPREEGAAIEQVGFGICVERKKSSKKRATQKNNAGERKVQRQGEISCEKRGRERRDKRPKKKGKKGHGKGWGGDRPLAQWAGIDSARLGPLKLHPHRNRGGR